MNSMSNLTFDEIEPGMAASLTRKLTPNMIEILALVSGDVSPFHLKGNEMETRKDTDVTQAVGAGAFISAVLGTQLPGPGMKITEEDLKFSGTINAGDELTASVTAKKKFSKGSMVLFDCKCVNQDGEVLVDGTVTVSAPTRRVSLSEVAPPQLVLRRGDAFIKLFKKCEDIPPVRCAVVYPCDKNSLLGPLEAARQGMIEPVLIGPETEIKSVADSENIDLGPYTVITVENSAAAAQKAVELARAGEVDSLMKGSLHTDELMEPVVSSATGLRTARRISHVFVMDVPSYPKMLLVTDAAINIYPKLAEKVDIVQNAIDLAHILGIDQPKVAILSAVETVNPKIESTLEASALCKMADRGQITGGILDGPLAFDNAISEEAARTKHITSAVAGHADILLVPDLEAGNMLAKQLSYLAGAESAGIVLGTRVPIVLTSRADSVRSRLASTAVMALVAHSKRTGTDILR
ncbi:MAG: bifunctional enoyl-CoA hydratase/phosphate acetyltransferase [Thermodesulfobacteriota bacterium]